MEGELEGRREEHERRERERRMGIQSAVVGGGDTYAGRREPRDVETRYEHGED